MPLVAAEEIVRRLTAPKMPLKQVPATTPRKRKRGLDLSSPGRVKHSRKGGTVTDFVQKVAGIGDPFAAPQPLRDQPEQQMDITINMANTAYPNSLCCVDLGAVKISQKNDTINATDVSDPAVFDSEFGHVVITTKNNKKWFLFGEIETDAFVGGSGVAFKSTNESSNVTFNGVRQLERFASKISLTYPTLNNDAQNPVNSPGDAFTKVVLWDQFVEIHMKNETITGGNETPLYVTCYVVQAKENIYQTASGTQAEILKEQIAGGFRQTYQTNALSDNSQQPLYTALSDNHYLMEKWKIVDKKEFCLAPGQIGRLSAFAPKPQILSYQYTLATQWEATGSPATYRPVIVKKGEQKLLFCIHGGIGAMDAQTNVGVEPCQLIMYATCRYKIAEYGENENVGYRSGDIATAGTTFDATSDIHNTGN